MSATLRFPFSGMLMLTISVISLSFGSALRAQTNTINTIEDPGSYIGVGASMTIGADGFPVMSYRDSSNDSLRVAKCSDADCTPSGITSSRIDSSGSPGYFTSITIGTDGFPVISYHDDSADDLRVAKCADAGCTSGTTITTVDASTDDVGEHTSIAIGTDGFPVISYSATDTGETTGWLKVVKCNDVACTGGDETISTVDSSSAYTGEWTSLAIGTDGLPVISYIDRAAGLTRVAKCNDNACSGGNETLTTVDSFTFLDTGDYTTSIAISSDNNPIISYHDHDALTLKVVKCGNSSCTSGNTLSIVDGPAEDVGAWSSLTIGNDGLPIISYHDTTERSLKVAKCNDIACSGANETITTLDDPVNEVGFTTTIVIGTNGNPVIAYRDSTGGDLKLARCNDTACSGGDETLVLIPRNPDGAGWYNSMAIGLDGFPVISYTAWRRNWLMVVKCGDAICSPGGQTVSRIDNNADRGNSIVIGLDGYPVISYYDEADENLKVAKCNDVACAGGDETISTVDDSADDVGYHNSIALGTDGFPIISYYDRTNDVLKAAKCNDAACSGGDETLSVVDAAIDTGYYSSVVIGSDGLPIIAYTDWDGSTGTKTAKCNDSACSGGDETISTINPDVSGEGVSIAQGSDGLPVIAHASWDGDLFVVKCNDLACSGQNELVTSVDGDFDHWSYFPAIAISNDGFPVISYEVYDSVTYLDVYKVLKCNDHACAGDGETITEVTNTAASVPNSSIAIGGDGLPVFTHYDWYDVKLDVAHCASADCVRPCNLDAFESFGSGGTDDTCSGSEIAIGSTQSHTQCDYDWVRFTPLAGNTYEIETSNLVNEADTVIGLFEECGASLDSDDDGGEGRASKLTWTSTNSNPLDVRIRSYSDDYIHFLHDKGYDISVKLLVGNFTVQKTYTDGNTTPVTIALSCTSGTVTPVDNQASPGDPATFTVENPGPGTTCTATESGVPAGYTKFESSCRNVDLNTGACTITNKRTSFDFNVAKQYVNSSTPSDVTVDLTCTPGNVVTLDNTASPSDDANFRVDNAEPYTTCTATESNVPANHSKNEADCLNVNVQQGGCTLVNTFVPTPPDAPNGLNAERAPDPTYLVINLDWADNSDDESGFRIERKLPGQAEFLTVKELPGVNDAISMSSFDNTRTCGTTFNYRVRAYNGAGISAPSNTATATTGTRTYCVSQKTSGSTTAGTFGSTGSGDDQLNSPGGADTDASGNIVIADTHNNRVQICDADGNCTVLDGTAGASGAGQGGLAGFNDPEDVAVDGDGRIIVADTGNDRIAVCQTGVCTYFGGLGSNAGQFNTPRGVAVDVAGRILVADTGNDRIQVCDDVGNCSAFGSLGTAFGQFDAPAGIASGVDNRIWVADTGNHRIQRCDTAGNCSGFGSFGQDLGQFDGPTRISMDMDERLVISDAGNQRVQLCNPEGVCTPLEGDYGTLLAVTIDDNSRIVVVDGTNNEVELLCLVSPESEFGSDAPWLLSNPRGVAVDGADRTIIADTDNHRILVCDQAWNCTTFGEEGQGVGQFWDPLDVAVDSNDRIIVADSRNSRIQICSDTGVCEAFGGPGSAIGQFEDIRSVAVDGLDRIIVADSYNQRIQVCDDQGNCTAFGSEGTSTGQFDRPSGVAVDSLDRIIIADTGNDRIQVCSDTGVCTAYGSSGVDWGEFSEPYDVAVDKDDRIIVTESLNNRVQVCDDIGSCSGFGGFGDAAGEFNQPLGAATASGGRIVIADTENDRIQVMRQCGPTDRAFISGFEQ